MRPKYFVKYVMSFRGRSSTPALFTVSKTSIPAPSIEGRALAVFLHLPSLTQVSQREQGPAQKENDFVNPLRKASRSVETKVWFRKMTEDELSAYVRTGEPLDKAGAYAIQGIGSLIVKKIEGDYFNVIGLPVASLAETLKKFGISVMDI